MGTRGTRFPAGLSPPSFWLRGYCPAGSGRRGSCGECRQLELLERAVQQGLASLNALRYFTDRRTSHCMSAYDVLTSLHGAVCAVVFAERLLASVQKRGETLLGSRSALQLLEVREVIADLCQVLRGIAEEAHDIGNDEW